MDKKQKKEMQNYALFRDIHYANYGTPYYKQVENSSSVVPNVIGMGLSDAIYLLESYGLLVQPIGRGKVSKQSLKAGQKLEKGQRIIIELS